MNPIVRFRLTCLLIGLLFSVNTTAQTELPALEVGKPVDRLIRSGETHSYTIKTEANQYLEVLIEHFGVEIGTKLFSPDGKKLLEIMAPNNRRRVSVLTETAGDHRLELDVVFEGFGVGQYTAEIVELRSGEQADVQALGAVTTMYEGLRLSGKYRSEKVPEQTLIAAIEKHKEALTLFQAAGDMAGKIDALWEIGRIKWHGLARYDSKNVVTAIKYLEEALALAERSGDKYRYASLLSDLAYINRDAARNLTRSVELFNKAISAFEALGKKRDVFHHYLGNAQNYQEAGDYDRALEEFFKAKAIEDSIPNLINTASGGIGINYARKGNAWKALEYQLKALAHAERIGNKLSTARQSINIGNRYTALGNLELALYYQQNAYQKFAEIDQKVGSDAAGMSGSGIGSALINIGTVYLRQGKSVEALKNYQEALPIFEEQKRADRISIVLQSIGDVYSDRDEFDRALEYYNRALEINKTLPDKSYSANQLANIATVYLLRGDYDKALTTFESVERIYKDIGNPVLLSRVNFKLGSTYVGLKQPLKARQAFEESIKNVEILRSQAGPEQTQFQGSIAPYLGMIDLLSLEGNAVEAFSYAERAKSSSLLDVLQNGRLDITKAMSAEEREQEKKRKKEIVQLNTNIAAEKDKARLDELNKQLETKRREFEDFQIRVYALKPELKVQRGEMKPISLEEAGNLLTDDKSALLEFVVGEDRSFLFVIGKDAARKVSLKVYPIEVKRKDLARQTESFNSKIAKGDLEFTRASQNLYNLLLKPAEAQLKNKTNLIIVPDASLWDMPFQALQNAPNKYLIEQAAVSYAPSLTALNEMVKKNKGKTFSGTTLLAFGNPTVNKETSDQLKQVFMSASLEPLPEAERLVNSLQKMYGANRSRVFVGADAREETAKTESSKFRIVQFAAHGVLNDFSPMYSHIVLAQKQGNPNEDGLLEAWEMKDLELNADMVILSACETARGKVSSGEGVIGMTWAMFIAGAPTTVASQWKVESSSTTELMLEFHRQLLGGKVSKADALRRASLKLMKTPKYKHPSYWAGFVIVGDGS